MNAFSPLKPLNPRSKTLILPRSLLSHLFSHSSTKTLTLEEAEPSSTPLTSLQCGRLLQSITNSKSLSKGLQLHAHAISSGVLRRNTYLATKLCAMYSLCGAATDARAVFDAIVLKSSFLWNVMIRGYACSGFPLKALVLYREMLGFGKRPDSFTYPYVLMACADLLLVEVGKRIHCEVIVYGYEADVYVGNSLLSMYSKFGEMGIARKVFDIMPTRDLTSWNTMISGYQKNNEPERALLVLFDLIGNGWGMDRATLLSVLPACADLSALKQTKEIHAYILRNFTEFDIFVVNAFIHVYAISGFLMGARHLFENNNKNDIVSWNSIISGYSHTGGAIESLRFFRQMNSQGIAPDTVTLIAVLGVCDRIAALQFGRSLHGYVTKRGYDREVTVNTSLIDMYSKCGSLECSRQVFDQMITRNLISWSAMISGYGLHGHGREAVQCYSEMKMNGVVPDNVTFTSVLSACSHAGLVNEGKKIFNEISKDYSLRPTVEHYTCIVDLLGRAGYLDQASEFIMNMDVEPNADVWAALLSACRIHQNVELAEYAAQNAFRLNPKGVGPYVCLSNLYAVKKRWTDVARVRAAARNNGLKKPPGCSFMELGMEIHRFMVGDKSHPQSNSIYAKLNELRKLVKDAGYVPDTSSVFYEVDEDVKEKLLWDHSERLAIAFALSNTSSEMSIRITKNLRVCEDCHAVTKLITKLVGREIIVRDAHRFHHFYNGLCSCGDYW
uniref:DYW domain-containing protein n=1 Tax=Ananas comosus var. bracteatus TaxID=296719 RepID=A0A6V7NKT8_ANACO|nr:unnamed protein product [Ananas comosus var. bracteatus]